MSAFKGTKKELLFDAISFLILIIAAVIGWFDIPSTLFFFASETTLIALTITFLYFNTGRTDRVFNIFISTIGLSTLSFLAALLPSLWVSAFEGDINSTNSIGLQYFLKMLEITWPLIVLNIFISWYSISNLKVEKKEIVLFQNLFASLFSILGIAVICLFLNEFVSGEAKYVLAGIIISRLIIFSYIHKGTIQSVFSKSKA